MKQAHFYNSVSGEPSGCLRAIAIGPLRVIVTDGFIPRDVLTIEICIYIRRVSKARPCFSVRTNVCALLSSFVLLVYTGELWLFFVDLLSGPRPSP